MKIFNVCTKKTFMKGDQEVCKWLQCGRLNMTDDGKMYLELNILPNQPFYVFENKPKEEKPQW
jgi:hypothetical protein